MCRDTHSTKSDNGIQCTSKFAMSMRASSHVMQMKVSGSGIPAQNVDLPIPSDADANYADIFSCNLGVLFQMDEQRRHSVKGSCKRKSKSLLAARDCKPQELQRSSHLASCSLTRLTFRLSPSPTLKPDHFNNSDKQKLSGSVPCNSAYRSNSTDPSQTEL